MRTHSERSMVKSQTEAEKDRKRESTLLKFQTVSAEQILWILNCSLPRKITTANLNCNFAAHDAQGKEPDAQA